MTEFCWIEPFLYSAPSLSREELKKFDIIVTLKETGDREPWYETAVRGPLYKRLDIPHQGIAADEEACKKLLRELVKCIREDEQRILLVCRDGVSNCGYFASAIRGWIEHIFDADTLVKRARDDLDFTTARSKEQRAQLKRLLAYAKEIELCPFIKRRKTIHSGEGASS